MHRIPLISLRVLIVVSPLLCLADRAHTQNEASATIHGVAADALEAYRWREVGPYRGGRSAAVAGVPDDRQLYYFGGTGGGVWKTIDGGRSWKNVSDGFFGGSIGAVAVSSWDPNVIYAGGGEKTLRGNVSHGDGMWRSTDAGRTWKQIGLLDSRHISRIRIHPKDPDLVYAAVMGHLFGPNEERGVFRSKDGGANWQRILFVSDKAGCVDLAMDPTNPRILYATIWEVRRTPYSLESGGPGSGIHKSTDGGDTWTEITSNEGLPEGPLGIIGITVSASNPDNLYAVIEAEDGGVFRSRDAGETWTQTSSDRSLRQRAWYYSRIYADPKDQEGVYVLNVQFHHSKDGGKSYTRISVPHGDNHDLWIDPEDPARMIQSNDGGANVSFDGGETWTQQDGQPTAQMYRVSTDNAFPYRLLGGQQDNSAVRIRSRSLLGGSIGVRDWEPTAGGESGFIVAKPDDPDLVVGGSYGGTMVITNHRTGERRSINVWPDDPMGWGAADLQYRFQWNYPIFFSPHDSDLLYAGGNALFLSRDLGGSWEPISPDLTRNDKSRQRSSGGLITQDNTSVEYYCTIFAAAESPHEPGVIWTGSDDGLIHITRNGGRDWVNVSPPDMPEWMQINTVEVHPTLKGGLYVAGTRYKSDDFAPYLYKTEDYGATWTEITEGIADDHFTRAIRADPDRPGLLYAGTERGVYVSYDDGNHWESLQLNLPIVPITDLAVKDGDLIAATQGRGFWILDDLSFLHQLSPRVAAADSHLFMPRPTYRVGAGGRFGRGGGNGGENPPSGVVFYYLLKDELAKDVAIELSITDLDDNEVRSYERKPAKKKADDDSDGDRNRGENTAVLETKAGLNQFVWNMSYAGAERFPGLVIWNRRMPGPRALPGNYRATLKIGEHSQTVDFEIIPDPRSSANMADMSAQFAFVTEVRDKLSELHSEIKTIRDLRSQIEGMKTRLADQEGAEGFVEAAARFDDDMTAIEESLYQTKNRSSQDPLNFPIRLNDKLAGLLSVVATGDFAPTRQAGEVKNQLFSSINLELSRLRELLENSLPALNAQAKAAGIPTLVNK